MNKRKLFIVEQYLSWKGHYRQYFENLLSDDFSYIYNAQEQNQYPNAIFLKADYKSKDVTTFIDFIKRRFLDSYKVYSKLIDQKPLVAHLLEFEPFSFLFLLMFRRKQIPLLIITVHSIERMRYANKVKDAISYLQRIIYAYTLRKAASRGSHFVTHYEYHKNQLIALIGNRYLNSIHVINYPCPEPSMLNMPRNSTKSDQILIYGQIREDKGIFEFLSDPETKDLSITIAGKIHDTRIFKFDYPNLKIIDKFISNEELISLTASHRFMLLPYSINYTGGAGTLKDSIAFGLPVIASNIPIFTEVIQKQNLGYIFNSIADIKTFKSQVDNTTYNQLTLNCLNYAKQHSWNSMRVSYFNLYQTFLEKCEDQECQDVIEN